MASEKQLIVEVRDKIATLKSQNFNLVGGNSDYDVVFDFDEDWSDFPTKTAIFIFGKAEPVYKVFEGNICNGVAINDATMCLIGVVAGNAKTTTPACVECVYRSITDEANGVPQPPTEDVYNQIMELLNRYINAVKGAPSGGKAGQVLKKNSDKDYDYSWQDITSGNTSSGATFIPSVSEEGVISWTNDKGLKNPEPRNIKGQKGDPYKLTENDKTEIVNAVLSALPDYREVKH